MALFQLYMKLLGAFEEMYIRGLSDTQRQALNQQGRLPLPMSASASFHGHNAPPPGSSGVMAQSQGPAGAEPSSNPISAGAAPPDNELDAEARKRKMDEATANNEESNGKRRKTGEFQHCSFFFPGCSKEDTKSDQSSDPELPDSSVIRSYLSSEYKYL